MKIVINRDENSREEIAIFLEDVAKEVRRGYWKGQDWEVEGEEENQHD